MGQHPILQLEENRAPPSGLPNGPNQPRDVGRDGGSARERVPLSSDLTPGNSEFAQRYDDVELFKFTSTLMSARIKLFAFMAKNDYLTWKSGVMLHLQPLMLGSITYGSERYDSRAGCM